MSFPMHEASSAFVANQTFRHVVPFTSAPCCGKNIALAVDLEAAACSDPYAIDRSCLGRHSSGTCDASHSSNLHQSVHGSVFTSPRPYSFRSGRFDLPAEGRLPAAMRLLGIDFSRLSDDVGHA